jgi:hypothetical protein
MRAPSSSSTRRVERPATEPRHAARRADRHTGARARLRESRLPARRRRADPPPLQRQRWIACRLRFKDWHRSPLLQPGKFTELFFVDEATAFAAGHRPCALCRREDYVAFLAFAGASSADEIDARLHEERVEPSTRAQRRHTAALDDLPDGTFVLSGGEPSLVFGDRLLIWSPGGYPHAVPRPRGDETTLLTPPSLVEVLRRGWQSSAVPLVHPSALA